MTTYSATRENEWDLFRDWILDLDHRIDLASSGADAAFAAVWTAAETETRKLYEARIHELEEALRRAWLYDGFACNVCYAACWDRPDIDAPPEIEHEPDCVMPSLLASASQPTKDGGQQ